MKNRTTILTRLTLFLCIALMGSTNACMAQFYNGNQSNNSRDLTVFYATSRYNESPSGRPLYGGARHLDIGAGSLDYGAINLLRPDQGPACVSATNWTDLRTVMGSRDTYWKQASVGQIAPMSASEFSRQLRDFHGLICVYVHGYDMTFEDTAREMAELVDEYKRRNSNQAILPILFSWPSPGKTADYTGDEANLEWSEKPFRDFIDLLVSEKNSDSYIDLIAHSMGSRYAFAYGVAKSQAPRAVFRNVILSCADMDYHTAEQKKEDLERCVGRSLYVLTNDSDGPLLTSQALHAQPRLGRPTDNGQTVRQNATGLIGTGASGLLAAKANLIGSGNLFGGSNKSQLFNELKGVANTFLRKDMGSANSQSPEINSWLNQNQYLSREWGTKSRLVDTTGFVTINMGHRLAWPLVAGLILSDPTYSPFVVTSIHKRPDALLLKQMGGSPRYLYRYDKIDLSRLGQ